MRAAPVVAIAIVLLLGACGGNGDSNSRTTSSGATGGTTAKSATGASGARGGKARGGREKGSKRGGAQKRRRAQGGGFEASGNVFFYKARSRCFAIPLGALARVYQATSDRPRDVARAYADREAPAPIYRQASIAGCLAGIESRRKR